MLKWCLEKSVFDEGKWEKSESAYVGSTYVGKMVYGYDTFLFNEDYANTLGSGKRSMAALWRSGYDENPTKADIENSGVWSECSLRHKVYYVYYYGNFYN